MYFSQILYIIMILMSTTAIMGYVSQGEKKQMSGPPVVVKAVPSVMA